MVGLLLLVFLFVGRGRASVERCSSWNRMVVASQGGGAYTSAEGAALRVAGFVRPNSTVVDIGGHLGRFSEAIIALGALPLTTLIFEPVRVLHLCQIQRLGNVSNNFGSHPFMQSCHYFSIASSDILPVGECAREKTVLSVILYTY